MTSITNGENLPGYKKKSFVLPYDGGQIWFEHLDGIYGYENLVLKKLKDDAPLFSKPSAPSQICFVFDQTKVTDTIIDVVKQSILESGKRFMKIAFAGLDRKSKHKIKKKLTGNGFDIGFFVGLEDAKEWLVKEIQ